MARKPAATKKKLEQTELKNLRAIQITIEASEGNLQRLAALLTFADHLTPKYEHQDKPLPWEDPNDPRYQQPPKLEIDRNAVQNAVMKDLEWFLARFGEGAARDLIRSHGGERLGELNDDQLLQLERQLSAVIEADHE